MCFIFTNTPYIIFHVSYFTLYKEIAAKPPGGRCSKIWVCKAKSDFIKKMEYFLAISLSFELVLFVRLPFVLKVDAHETHGDLITLMCIVQAFVENEFVITRSFA